MLSEWSYQIGYVLDPVYARKAERITAKARKYGITVLPQPTSYDEKSEDWNFSSGFWLLKGETERRLRREIRNEQRANYDEFRKWATVVFAVLGFALGMAALWVKQKQPDPCPRNYYRNDSGECVFVLEKPVQTQPENIPARPSDAPPPPPRHRPSRKQ